MPTLEITTMVGCPLMCTFCPQDKLKAAVGGGEKYMSLAAFRRIVSTVPTYVRIDFSGMSEPWANPETTGMLRHALESGYNVTVYTTLYGMSDPDAVIGLLRDHAAQVEALVIHLPDVNGNMRGWRWSEEYARTLSAFADLGEREGAMRDFRMMTMDGESRPHPDVFRSKIGGDFAKWHPNRRAGSLTLSDIGAQKVEERVDHAWPVSCSFTPFYDQNVVLPNGDVLLCCMDYGARHRIGNLLTGDYFSLFTSPEMTRLRAANMMPCGGGTICKSCSRATVYHLGATKRQFWEAAQ